MSLGLVPAATGIANPSNQSALAAPAPQVAAQKFGLTRGEILLAGANAIQVVGMMGLVPAVLAPPVLTVAGVGAGIAGYWMLPKDASLLQRAMAIPMVVNKVVGMHPIISGIFQANSLYNLAKNSESRLSEAWSQIRTNPIEALKVTGVSLFNLATSVALIAGSLGLFKKTADPASSQEAERFPPDTCPASQYTKISKALVHVPGPEQPAPHLVDMPQTKVPEAVIRGGSDWLAFHERLSAADPSKQIMLRMRGDVVAVPGRPQAKTSAVNIPQQRVPDMVIAGHSDWPALETADPSKQIMLRMRGDVVAVPGRQQPKTSAVNIPQQRVPDMVIAGHSDWPALETTDPSKQITLRMSGDVVAVPGRQQAKTSAVNIPQQRVPDMVIAGHSDWPALETTDPSKQITLRMSGDVVAVPGRQQAKTSAVNIPQQRVPATVIRDRGDG